ncbi:MAG: hypothetical protein IH889_10015 [Planctomycetes bacterium]|nr:hypothetical protein [Planctomycetota bacterium]
MKPFPTRARLARLGAASATMIAIGTVASPSHAQCQYDVTVLQFPIDCGIGTVITAGLSLHEKGAVVGRYKCPVSKYSQGFLWTAAGGFVGLEPPPGVIEVVATDINDQGVICGTMIVADIGFRGFVYDHGAWTVLPPVVDVLGTWSSAAAINNKGIVVGQRSITENLNPQNAYIWSREEGFTDLGVLQGPYSAATAISSNGAVGGWTGTGTTTSEAFLWFDGNVTLFGPVPDGLTSTVSALGDDGAVVGSGRIPFDGAPFGANRAFLWENGEFTMLGTLPDHTRSGAGDIRSTRQQVVGNSSNVDGNPNIRHGFIWQSGLMTNLNDLIPADLSLVITSAPANNGSGLILTNASSTDGLVSVLLAPVESPLGDLDADCQVGILDLLFLLAQWGQTGSPADLNNDGLVGILDLLILLANWT